MSNLQLRLLKARLESVRQSLARTSHKDKGESIAETTANDFNSLLEQIATAVPKAAAVLPSPIKTGGLGATFNLAEASFVDLGLAVDQAIAVIEVLESENG